MYSDESPGLSLFRSFYTTMCVLLFFAGIVATITWKVVESRQASEATERTSAMSAPNSASPSAPAGQSVPVQSVPPPVFTTHAAQEPSSPSVEMPRRPKYQLTLVEPKPPNSADFSLVMQECHREAETIQCAAQALNNTDAPTNMAMDMATAVDDEGNTPLAGWTAPPRLIPGAAANVYFQIKDAHLNVKTITLEVRFKWERNTDLNDLVFSTIPVQ